MLANIDLLIAMTELKKKLYLLDNDDPVILLALNCLADITAHISILNPTLYVDPLGQSLRRSDENA